MAAEQACKRQSSPRYALSRWKGLTRFLDDGRIEKRAQCPGAHDPPNRSEQEECSVHQTVGVARSTLRAAGCSDGPSQSSSRKGLGISDA
jgi:hypothetical protein